MFTGAGTGPKVRAGGQHGAASYRSLRWRATSTMATHPAADHDARRRLRWQIDPDRNARPVHDPRVQKMQHLLHRACRRPANLPALDQGRYPPDRQGQAPRLIVEGHPRKPVFAEMQPSDRMTRPKHIRIVHQTMRSESDRSASGLITRRSAVQIRPPPPSSEQYPRPLPTEGPRRVCSHVPRRLPPLRHAGPGSQAAICR